MITQKPVSGHIGRSLTHHGKIMCSRHLLIRSGPGGLMDTAVTTAFARSEKTVIFDNSPLDVPPGYIQSKGLGNQETEIRNFVQAEIAKIITAKDLSEVDALYNNMVKKATSMGLDKIDEAKDAIMKQQSKEMGIPMMGINE